MNKINWGRVLLGGLVAGLIINIVEFIMNTLVLKDEWAKAMKDLGKSGEFGTGAMVTFVIIGFALGIAIVWLYAAIRPRYGAGVKTALCAGAATWFFYSALGSVAIIAMGLFPSNLVHIGAAYGLVEILAAAVAGAALYKEA